MLTFLAGISQREVAEHFPALVQGRDRYADIIEDFFEDHLQSRFSVPDYVFDVYLTSAGKVEPRCCCPFDHNDAIHILLARVQFALLWPLQVLRAPSQFTL